MYRHALSRECKQDGRWHDASTFQYSSNKDLPIQDVVSYAKEVASGGANHNMITVACNQYSFTTAQSFAFAAEMSARKKSEFIKLSSLFLVNSPEWRYTEGLGNWVRANDQWSFESARYFGSHGLEIMKTRVVMIGKKAEDTEE
jgi:Delta6-protoilludene synthase